MYDYATKKWTDWEDGYNTFVINCDENKDIAHFKANGDQVIYRRISQKIEEGYTNEGNEHYQIIKALDEDGVIFSFKYLTIKQLDKN